MSALRALLINWGVPQPYGRGYFMSALSRLYPVATARGSDTDSVAKFATNRHKRIKGYSGSLSFVPLALLWLDFSFCVICEIC